VTTGGRHTFVLDVGDVLNYPVEFLGDDVILANLNKLSHQMSPLMRDVIRC